MPVPARYARIPAAGRLTQIHDFSPQLHHYISRLQVVVAGFFTGLGIAVTALAWQGVRSGQPWAFSAAFAAPAVAVARALPLRYARGFTTMGRLRLIYTGAGILAVGTFLAWRTMSRA